MGIYSIIFLRWNFTVIAIYRLGRNIYHTFDISADRSLKYFLCKIYACSQGSSNLGTGKSTMYYTVYCRKINFSGFKILQIIVCNMIKVQKSFLQTIFIQIQS